MKLILFALVAGAIAVSAATNLLDQPGFEGTYTNGVALGWKKFAIRGTARGSFLESTIAHAGAKAQLLQLDEQLIGLQLVASGVLASNLARPTIALQRVPGSNMLVLSWPGDYSGWL